MAIRLAGLSDGMTQARAQVVPAGGSLRARLWRGLNWLLEHSLPEPDLICGEADAVSMLARIGRDQQLEAGCFWKLRRR